MVELILACARRGRPLQVETLNEAESGLVVAGGHNDSLSKLRGETDHATVWWGDSGVWWCVGHEVDDDFKITREVYRVAPGDVGIALRCHEAEARLQAGGGDGDLVAAYNAARDAGQYDRAAEIVDAAAGHATAEPLLIERPAQAALLHAGRHPHVGWVQLPGGTLALRLPSKGNDHGYVICDDSTAQPGGAEGAGFKEWIEINLDDPRLKGWATAPLQGLVAAHGYLTAERVVCRLGDLVAALGAFSLRWLSHADLDGEVVVRLHLNGTCSVSAVGECAALESPPADFDGETRRTGWAPEGVDEWRLLRRSLQSSPHVLPVGDCQAERLGSRYRCGVSPDRYGLYIDDAAERLGALHEHGPAFTSYRFPDRSVLHIESDGDFWWQPPPR